MFVCFFSLQTNVYRFHAWEDHPGIEDSWSEQSCLPAGRGGQTGQSCSVKEADHGVNSHPLYLSLSLPLSLSSKRVCRVTQQLPSWRFWTPNKTAPSPTSILTETCSLVFPPCAAKEHNCVEEWELRGPKRTEDEWRVVSS